MYVRIGVYGAVKAGSIWGGYIYIYACKEEDDLSLKGSGPVERVDERDERRKL